jgi:hypothetical protein
MEYRIATPTVPACDIIKQATDCAGTTELGIIIGWFASIPIRLVMTPPIIPVSFARPR